MGKPHTIVGAPAHNRLEKKKQSSKRRMQQLPLVEEQSEAESALDVQLEQSQGAVHQVTRSMQLITRVETEYANFTVCVSVCMCP